MKKQFTLGIVFFLVAIVGFAQTWTGIGSDKPVPIRKSLVQTSEQSIIIKFNVDGFFMTPVETPRGKEFQISVPDMVFLNEKTMPELPMHGVSAIIPDLALMKVRVLSSSYTDFSGISVAPSKGHYLRSEDPKSIPYIYSNIYDQDVFYPQNLCELQEPYIFRDYRGQTLTVYPVSYNAVTKTLRVYHEMVVEVYNAGDGGTNQYFRSSFSDRVPREYTAIYERHFINYSQNRYPILEEEGNMLIICHAPFMDAVQPLVAWKKLIGRPTQIVNVSTIGTTPAAIKAYVQNYYNTNGLTHLLLVGDHQHVPSQSMSGGFSDNFYGYLTGNDSYSEVFVGRFSAETLPDVQTQVQRTIHYERDINQNDTWLSTGIGVARNEGAGNGHNGGESDYVHMDYIRDSLLNYTYSVVHREYDGNVPGLPNTNAAQLSQRINDGASIINYCNHGSMTSWSVAGYSTTHVDALTNVGKLPYIWAVACDNGKFTSGTCFAEVWMRAKHNTTGEPTGAIGTMMSWISQPWQPPMTGQDEMVTILVEKRNHIKRTLGGLSINGSAKMIEAHGSSGLSTHDTWILFGDPSLTVRTANPTLMTVTHMPTLFLGSSNFTVNANAEGAIVALTINGEILGTAYISNGTATVQFPNVTTPGTMKVVVFGFNRVTYIQEIDVIPASGPYVIYTSSVINDVIGGNGNGQIDFGESIVLGVELKNIGIETATNLVATLTTTSPYVTITDGVQNYGNITPDELVMINNAFAFSVSNNVPDKTNLAFQIEITGTQGTWTGSFNRMAYAPAFTVGNLMITDPLGNNNGQADPGETVNLNIPTLNSGSSQASNIAGVLTSNNPYVTINVGSVNFASLDPNQSVNAVFTVTIAENTPIGTPIAFNYSVTMGAYTASKDFVVQVGLIFENFETGNFSMFPWANGGNLPWTITNVAPYEGVYSAKSGAITHSQSSQLILTYDVGGNDSISFYRKVSSEANYDYLKFFINNQMVAQWAGTVPWGRVVFPVTGGVKTFKWEYMKDGSVSTGDDCAWIDYIVFPAPSACPSPANLQATSVTSSSAVLTWISGANISQWDLIWGAAGFNPASSGTLVSGLTATTHALNGLNPVTAYDFYVRSVCTRDMTSAWSGPATFTTLCDIFSLPYTEPFGTPAVTCWSFPQGQGNWAFGSTYTPPSSTSGAPNAFFNWSPSVTNYSFSLTSPLFNATGWSDVKIDFKLFINSYSNTTVENMAVEYKLLDQTVWTLLENFSTAGLGSGQAEHVRVNQALAGVGGNQFQVRFRAHGPNSFNINGWGLDDIHIHGTSGPVVVPGDSNCDGNVNVLDAITSVSYVMGQNPNPFCLLNADVTGDGVVNVLDVIGTVNIILGGTKTSRPGLNSASATLFLDRKGIALESDGTLAGLQFEINGLENAELNLALEGYELVINIQDGKLMGMIFSFDNKPLPAGKISLVNFSGEINNLQWGAVVAGNLNAEEVNVVKHLEGRTNVLSTDFGLRAYPNPSQGQFVIETKLPVAADTKIRILNMMGTEVMVLQNGLLSGGTHRFEINDNNQLRSGVYFLQLNATPQEAPGLLINQYQRLVISK